jgi:hypothetical protein
MKLMTVTRDTHRATWATVVTVPGRGHLLGPRRVTRHSSHTPPTTRGLFVIDVNSSSIGLAMPPLFPFKKKGLLHFSK